MVVTLENLGATLDDKPVLIPIGLGTLHEKEDVVIVPDFHTDQLQEMPLYIKDEVTHQFEDQIRDIIGSPAALRMEEKITELDRKAFYDHHHFDRSGFQKTETPHADNPVIQDENEASREEERQTIHDLIDRSKTENEL